MNVTSKTATQGELMDAAERAASQVGVRLYEPRNSGKGVAFTLKTEGPRPKYRRLSTLPSYRRDGRGVRTLPGRVCWHGVRDFLRAFYARIPDARVRTAMATYQGAAHFERSYANTFETSAPYMGFHLTAPSDQACACDETPSEIVFVEHEGPPDTWGAYERQYSRLKDRMQKVVERIATELRAGGLEVETWETNAEDYGFQLLAKPKDGSDEDGIDMDLTIWDSGDADDGIYGQHGNFHCGITRYGGEILGGFTPYNYSERVWVDYTNDAEWDERMDLVESGLENAAEFILERAS